MKKSEINRLREKTRKNLGVKIKEIRESKNLTQVDLTGKIEGPFDTSNLSRIESGRINTTAFTLFRIAKALEVSICELLDIELKENLKPIDTPLKSQLSPWICGCKKSMIIVQAQKMFSCQNRWGCLVRGERGGGTVGWCIRA